MKKKLAAILFLVFALAIPLAMFCAFPLTATAALGEYNSGDIAVINAMIDKNGLAWSR